jgi:membrane protein implicated in regulation of membrane protease activity
MWDDFEEKVFKSFVAIVIILAFGFMLALALCIAPEAVLFVVGLLALSVLVAGIWTIAEKISDEIAFRKIYKGWTLNDKVRDKVAISLNIYGKQEEENNENLM